MEANTIKNETGFLQGGGEMGELIKSFDWETTALGKPGDWPLSLKVSVGTILHSAFPMFLFWGKDLISFYNDSFRPSLGINGKHSAIGKKAREVWPEIWDFIGPLLEKVLTTGEAVFFEDQLVPFFRNGKIEDIYWTFSYSPAYGDTGNIEGVLVTCSETTDKVLAIRSLKESETRFRSLIEAAPLATCLFTGKEMRVEIVNDIVLMHWGKGNSVIGKPLVEILPEIKDQEFPALLENVFNTGDTYEAKAAQVELVVNGIPGTYYFDFTYKAVRHKDGEIYGVMSMSLDVTQQVIAKRQAEESEAHLQLLRDSVPAMIFYLDHEQRYRSYNGVFRNWFNVDGTYAIGKTVREFIGEEAYEKASPYLNKAYSGEQTRYELFTPSITAGDKWLDIVYTPNIDSNGIVIGISVHAVDITQSKLTELSLRNSELFAHDVIYNSPVAKIVYTGPEMTVSIANENMLQLIGRDASVIGKPFVEAIPELAGSIIEERMRTVFLTGEMYSQAEELIPLVRFGQPYAGYYNYIYKALRDVSGNIYGIIATATEVTEQVIARKKVEGKERELRDLINAAPIGICVLHGIEAWIDEVNERFIAISGKRKEQFVNATYWEVFPEVAEPFAPVLENVFKTGIKYTTEEAEMVLIRHGIPETIFATFEYVPVLDINNTVIKVIVLVIEVTHQVETRKEIEAAVTARTEELAESNLNLKRSNAELEQFAYIASHDLQEPIRKISTFTQMLEHSIPHITDKSKDYISKIYSSTDRMTNLIRDVLAFSTVTHANDNFEPLHLAQIMDSVKADFEFQIEKTNAVIEVGSLPVILGSATQMHQLFGNLLSNSLKYIKPEIKPVIEISSSFAKKEVIAQYPALDISKKYYHIEFSDNGIGFDTEHVERIFRIFQRLHAKNEFEGTGIGLSICKKIVQSHHGHIAAAQGENGGAVFNILLPELI